MVVFVGDDICALFKKAFSSHEKQATCTLNSESLSSFDSFLCSAEIQVSYNECHGHAITSDIQPNSVRSQTQWAG